MKRLAPLVRATALAFSLGSLGAAVAAETVVVVAVQADPEHLNPGITTASHTHAVSNSLFNGLVGRDRDNRPVPDLAERWTVSPDGTAYTFHLAEARWHDGRPVTSADVKFSFERVLLQHHARTAASLKGLIAGIDTPDARTVTIRLSKPYAPLLQQLDVTEAPILPAHVFGDADPRNHPANLAPVGSGPFRFAGYSRDDSVTLVRNPDYFKPGLPRIDRLVFRVLPDARTALLAYQAGEVDVLRSVGGADARVLGARPGTVVESVGSGPGGGNCVMTVVFNLDRPALADLRVRQAVAHAVDRRRMVDDILFGHGRVAAAPIASGIGWAHDAAALAGIPHDPARAAALLDAAGLKPGADGVRLTLDAVHFPQFGRYADAMRQDLAAVGIALVSRPLDRAATVDAIYTRRDFDTGLISYCHGLDPEIGFRRTLASDAIGPVPFSNGAGYRDAEVDALFAQAVSTVDLEARGAIYARIQAIAARDLPYWWLVETDSLSAWRADLAGFTMWSGQFAEAAGPR
jgi:peptide/nickel transport system substrate-binding protein